MTLRFLFIVLSPALLLCVSCDSEVNITGKPVIAYADIFRSSDYTMYPESDISKVSEEVIDSAKTSVTCAPLCLEKGNVIFALQNKTVVSTTYATVNWKFTTDDIINNSSLIADNEHNLYFATSKGTVYSVTSAGKLRWKKTLSADSLLPFNSNIQLLTNGIVVANGSGLVQKFDFNGKALWQYISYNTPNHTFAADANNNIIMVFHDKQIGGTDSLVMIGDDGKMKWQEPINQTNVSCNISWVGGSIYVGGERMIANKRVPVIHCYNNAGQIVWSRQLPVTPRGISVGLSDSLLYVVGYNAQIQHEPKSDVIALHKTGGSIVWELWFDYAIDHPVIITENYLQFLGTQNHSTGFYRMNKNGTLHSLVSLSNSDEVYPLPTIAPNGTIVMGSTQHAGVVTLSGSLLDM
ncbi:MAG: PQQ-binding-like beta-propeller repeat protein [Candidatus Kapabacteria bacterium]|nr:PQQ-binding-like beta-propeller repeat protein [Candidatus Kapabacteria bacterium]